METLSPVSSSGRGRHRRSGALLSSGSVVFLRLLNMVKVVKVYKEKFTEPENASSIPEDMDAVAQQYGARFTYVSKRMPDVD